MPSSRPVTPSSPAPCRRQTARPASSPSSWGAESAPFNDSWLAGGIVQGNSLFVTVNFKLLKNLPLASPVTINPTVDFAATEINAKALPVQVQHSTAPNPEWFVVTGNP